MAAPVAAFRTITEVWSGRERVVAGVLALAVGALGALSGTTPSAAAASGATRASSSEAVLLGSANPPAPDDERLAVYDEALVALTQELSYLVLLGWVRAPAPPEARNMPSAIGIERMDVADMIDAIRYLDLQRGPDALARLRELGELVSPQVEQVLGANLPFVAGEVPTIGAELYLVAYDDLLEVWSVLRSQVVPSTVPGVGPVASPITTGPTGTSPTPTVTSPITTSPTVTSPAGTGPTVTSPTVSVGSGDSVDVDAPADDSGPLVLVLAALGGVGLAGAVAGVVASTRRRRVRVAEAVVGAVESVAQDDVLDAGRRIMAASDPDEFGALVAEQAGRLVGAPGAVVIDGRTWNPSGLDMPDTAAIDRALSTGRPVKTAASVVVPVVADGRVLGALVAWTTDAGGAEVLGAFAPIVGAALQGVRARIEHEHLAFDDALTGVGNRRRFDRDLERLVGAGSGRGLPVALAMVDVDHFKRFNDTHGHPLGDAVLRHVAAVVSANVREGDLVYRYGGEEFAILLPGAELDEATAVVERVRVAIAVTPFRQGDIELPPVTVSVGVSATPPVDGAAMVRIADGALYAAKSNGRNRVEVCPPV